MIRAAIESDLPVLYSIYVRSLAQAKQPCGAAWNRGQFQSEFENGRTWVLVGEDSAIRGFVFARDNGEAWEITQLATDPNYWNQGLMQFLLRQVEVDLPGSKLWLEVHEQNTPACRLYDKLGFKVVGRRKAYYLDGGAALLYSKS